MTSRSVSQSKKQRRSFALEALEPRFAMATLGLGVRVLNDVAGAPGAARVEPLKVGDNFWVEVRAQDIRAAQVNPAGVIGLALNLSWDSDNLQLLNPPTAFAPNMVVPNDLITPAFPLVRTVDAFNPTDGHTNTVNLPLVPNIANMQAGALPNAGQGTPIGAVDPNNANDPNFGFFTLLQFKALAVGDDTPFTMELETPADFADADILNGVAALTARQVRTDVAAPNVDQQNLAVTEFLEIDAVVVPPARGRASLSGYAFADANLNGIFDKAVDGTPQEFVLPNVRVQLFREGTAAAIATTTTGPDGAYFFENLAAGTYRIVEIQPTTYVDAGTQLGTIVANAAGGGSNPPNLAARVGVAGTNEFTGILLRGNEHGIEYNFGDNVIPTKNMFRARTIPQVALNQQLGLRTAVIRATAAADTIAMQVTPAAVVVTTNNVPRVINRTRFDVIYVPDLTEADTVTIDGTAESEQAHFTPGRAAYRIGNAYASTNFGIVVEGNAKTTITSGDGGNDRAVFRDSLATNDALVAALSTTTLTNTANRFAQSAGFFDNVRAITQRAAAAAEDDTAQIAANTDYLLNLIGDWRVI